MTDPIFQIPTDFNLDLQDPILKNDIEFTPDRIKYLEDNQSKCFLCRWILEDYRANGTLKGHWNKDGTLEIFPVRGEISHLWLELYGKPYPWNAPLKKHEEKPSSFDTDGKLVAVEPSVAPAPRPIKREPQGTLPGIMNPNPHNVPLSRPKNAKRLRM